MVTSTAACHETSQLLPPKVPSNGNGSSDEGEDSKKKSIGYLGSCAIAVNSLAGPAILQLPYQYQQSGIIPTTTCLVLVAIFSSLVCLHMAQTIQMIGRNKDYNQCIEFSDVFQVYSGRRMYLVTQLLFFLTAVVMNIAATIDTAQTVDTFLGLHAQTMAVAVRLPPSIQIESWSHEATTCTRRMVKVGDCTPFHESSSASPLLLTVGYLLTAAVFVPISLLDLKENTHWQVVGFAILITSSAYFSLVLATQFPFHMDPAMIVPEDDTLDYSWYSHHMFDYVSWWGESYSDMLGVILFNFSLVLAIPAWLHEKQPHVSVPAVIGTSTVLSTALYVVVGLIGATTIPRVNVNMLNPMVSGAFGTDIQVAASIFAFFIIGLDIPLFAVLTRYNLTHSGLCSVRTANILVVYLPWCVGWIFYAGNAVGALLQWGGILFTSAVAFVLPLYIAIKALQKVQNSHEMSEFFRTTAQDSHNDFYIYGKQVSSSFKFQLIVLHVLLVIATGGVLTTIVGELTTERHEYLQSNMYLNSVNVTDLVAEKKRKNATKAGSNVSSLHL
jgi:amino acid permease